MVNNSLNPKVIYIPAKIEPNKKVAIHCVRLVQIKRMLRGAIEGLKQIVKNNPN